VSRRLFSCAGGTLVLPDMVLLDRADGGHLCVDPPRQVWERSELSPMELTQWSFLVAAAGAALLDVLPQLAGGCVNYWEAGNWSLHHDAPPAGAKHAPSHRRVHLHLFGRSPTAGDADWLWGEAPRFPPFAKRREWAERFAPLAADECAAVVARAAVLLRDRYGAPQSAVAPWSRCATCEYPTVGAAARCLDCSG